MAKNRLHKGAIFHFPPVASYSRCIAFFRFLLLFHKQLFSLDKLLRNFCFAPLDLLRSTYTARTMRFEKQILRHVVQFCAFKNEAHNDRQ